jgi:hypothetical protein
MAGMALGYTDSVLEVCSEVCEAGEIFTRRSSALFITLLSDTWQTPLANRSQEFQPWKCGGRCPGNPVRVDLAVDYIFSKHLHVPATNGVPQISHSCGRLLR